MDSPLATSFVTDSIVSQWSNRMVNKILSFIRGSAKALYLYTCKNFYTRHKNSTKTFSKSLLRKFSGVVFSTKRIRLCNSEPCVVLYFTVVLQNLYHQASAYYLHAGKQMRSLYHHISLATLSKHLLIPVQLIFHRFHNYCNFQYGG